MAQVGEPGLQALILLAPGIAAPVEGVLKALHAGLVSIVDHGGAGEGKKYQRSQAYQSGSFQPLGRSQAVHGPLVLALGHGVGAQHRQDAGGVVGAQEVHGGVEGGRGVVLPQGLHGLPEVVGIAALQIGQQRRAEGIVHDAVELAAQQVAAPLGVGDLVAGVLPHLADEHGVGLGLLHGAADLFNEPVRQLVGHVQPPAGGAGPEPAADDRVLPVDNVVYISLAFLPDGRQGADAPPGVVVVGPGMERVPVVVGALLALGGAQGGVKAVGVEIEALGAGVVKDAVQNHMHAPALRLPAQGAEILLRAQHGVDLAVIRRVVAVVGGGLENGAQIQGSHAHAGQLIQLGRDARKLSAEEVAVADLSVRVRPPLGHVVPVFLDPAVAHQSLGMGVRQAAEAVWENLVRHTLAEPGGGAAFLIDGHLPGSGGLVAAVAGLVKNAAGAVVPPEREVIPDELRLLGGHHGGGKVHPVRRGLRGGQLDGLGAAGELVVQNESAVGEALLCQGTAVEAHHGAAGDGAERVFAEDAAGVKHKGLAHGSGASFLLK